MGRTVTTPEGTRWQVGRRWLPWRPRFRGPYDVGDAPFEPLYFPDDLAGVVGVVVAIVLVAAFVFLVIPLLVTLVEIVLVALLVALGVLVRVLLRRPWIIDAVSLDRGDRLSWKVVGWRRSGEVVDAVSAQLSTGQEPTALPDASPC